MCQILIDLTCDFIHNNCFAFSLAKLSRYLYQYSFFSPFYHFMKQKPINTSFKTEMKLSQAHLIQTCIMQGPTMDLSKPSQQPNPILHKTCRTTVHGNRLRFDSSSMDPISNAYSDASDEEESDLLTSREPYAKRLKPETSPSTAFRPNSYSSIQQNEPPIGG